MRSNAFRRHLRRASSAAALTLLALAGLDTSGLAQQVDPPGSGSTRRFYADDPLLRDADSQNIEPVADYDLSKSYDFLWHTFSESSSGTSGPALNVNTLGEVPDSSWFTNRIGQREMTLDELVRGPDSNDGPAPGKWIVTGRPDAGITPKFTIRDALGNVYLIKLDPADFPELPSSVEVISTKIFHAIGYHVPEDFIVRFDPAQLEPGPHATMRTETGKKRAIHAEDIGQWLKRQPRGADGRIRALASRYVPGKVVGQFQYVGTRSDDPNDIFPHERRRELRGMRVFAAWLNHDDARSLNSIDSYVEEDGRHYVRHYLQDFGSNLGSGSTSAQQPRGGYEYLIERGSIAKGLATMGLWSRGWMNVKYPTAPSLGNVEADFFEPWKWKTEYPQPAFNRMDAADAFWAASIAARFTDPMIEAIVATGRLSDEAAARQLTRIVIKRRDKVVAYWITRTNPLDRFEVQAAGASHELTFDNAAIRVGAAAPRASYAARWFAFDNGSGEERAVGGEAALSDTRVTVPDTAWGPRDDAGDRYGVVAIRTMHHDFANWEQPVRVALRNRDGIVTVVGIERPR
jgi:hypothetical protein